MTASNPTLAHETTPFSEFISEAVPGGVGVLEFELGEVGLVASAGLAAILLKDALLETVPDPCYYDTYAAHWEVYASLVRLFATEESVDAIEQLSARIEATTAASYADAIACSG